MRYFARSKFSRSLVHFQVKFELDMTSSYDMYFVMRGRIPLLNLNELREKLQPTIILG